jgi:hypothetical protein
MQSTYDNFNEENEISFFFQDEKQGRYTAKIVNYENRTEMEDGKGDIVTVRSSVFLPLSILTSLLE